MTARCRCGKICKNSRGFKIHQARKRCLEGENVPQHTDTTSDETQEDPGQEAPHGAQSLRVAQLVPCSPSLAKVQTKWEAPKWPQACKTTVWEQFDGDVNKVLEAPVKGEVDQRLWMMMTISTSLAQE